MFPYVHRGVLSNAGRVVPTVEADKGFKTTDHRESLEDESVMTVLNSIVDT